MVWFPYAIKIYEFMHRRYELFLRVTLLATSYEYERFLVYEYWICMTTEYDIYDYAGIKIVHREDYGISSMHYTRID